MAVDEAVDISQRALENVSPFERWRRVTLAYVAPPFVTGLRSSTPAAVTQKLLTAPKEFVGQQDSLWWLTNCRA